MEPTALEFFRTILETPSPSGYESSLQQIVRDYVADFADEVRTDVHGNVIAVKNPDAPLRVMFAWGVHVFTASGAVVAPMECPMSAERVGLRRIGSSPGSPQSAPVRHAGPPERAPDRGR